MKSVKYKMKARGQRIFIRVFDFLGKKYIIKRESYIDSYDNHFYVVNPVFETIKYYAFNNGVNVKEDCAIKVAKMEQIAEEDINIEREVEIPYFIFSPKPSFEDKIKSIEITARKSKIVGK